jgi:predicted nucleic acid-binding protein
MAELLLETQAGLEVAGSLRGRAVHAPAHVDVEVASVIRKAVARDLISDRDGLIAIAELHALPMRRWPIVPLIDRAYALRSTHSIPDGLYVALAEGLSTTLITCDERLAHSHGHRADIRLPNSR